MTSKAEKEFEKRLKAELIDAAQRVEVTPQKLKDILKRAEKNERSDK